MPSVIQIPNLPGVADLTTADQMEMVQAGVSVKVNVQQLGQFIMDRYATLPFVPTDGEDGDLVGIVDGGLAPVKLVFEEATLDANLGADTLVYYPAAEGAVNFPDDSLGWTIQRSLLASGSLAGNLTDFAVDSLTGRIATRGKNGGVWSGWGFTEGNFATRAELVTWADKVVPRVGTVVWAAGLSYRYIGTGTAIIDMAGWVPNEDIYPDHMTYNATPGTTDMTAAIVAALAYAASIGGGVVRLLASTYFVSSTITMAVSGVSLIGAGELLTTITRSGDFGTTVLVTGNDTTGTAILFVEVSGIYFESTGLTTSGAHIHWNGSAFCAMRDIFFWNGFIAMRFSGATSLHVERVRTVWSNLYSGSATGRRFILCDDAASTYAHPSSGDLFIDSFNLRCSSDNPYVEVGCEIKSADGIWFDNGHYGGASKANLWFNAVSTHSIGLVFHEQVMFDANAGNGILFSGSTTPGRNIYFTGCNAKGGAIGDTGIYAEPGANFINVQWNGGFVTEFAMTGILLNSSAVKNWQFNDIQVRGNSYGNTGTYAGIQIAAGTGIRFNGGQSGRLNVADTPASQSYGMIVGASASDILISNMDFSYNVTAPTLVNGSSTNVRFVGCTSDASATVASASTLDPPRELQGIYVTGTTNTTNMVLQGRGSYITMRFEGAVTISGAGNLKTGAALTTVADQVLSFQCDGTNWYLLSGRVPMTSGTNANGDWIRFSDGTQQVRASLTVNAAIATAYTAGGFRNTGQTWTYPIAFKTATVPQTYGTPNDVTSVAVTTRNASATAVSIFHWAPASIGVAADLLASVKAEGWWL